MSRCSKLTQRQQGKLMRTTSRLSLHCRAVLSSSVIRYQPGNSVFPYWPGATPTGVRVNVKSVVSRTGCHKWNDRDLQRRIRIQFLINDLVFIKTVHNRISWKFFSLHHEYTVDKESGARCFITLMQSTTTPSRELRKQNTEIVKAA